jgi:flagellar protein FliJ
MKSRDSLLRLKRFDLDAKRRRVTQIEMSVAEFDRMAAELDKEIATEETRARISDPSHYAYPTYAKAAMVRRDNLRRSANDLREQLEQARAEMAEAFEELKKVEILDDREKAAERAEIAAREQAEHDAVGLRGFAARAV